MVTSRERVMRAVRRQEPLDGRVPIDVGGVGFPACPHRF
jgi:hypothetical protein